jgi:hypothetical protein
MALPATASLPNSGDIVSRWNLTANGSDSVGSNTLTAANITYTSGQFGVDCAVFNGSSANFSITDASQTGLDFQDHTIAGWLYVASAPGTYCTWGKGDAIEQYRTFYRNSSGLKIESDYFNTLVETQINASIDLGTETWKRVLVSFDVSAKTGIVAIDGTVISSSISPTTATSVRNASGPFNIGSYNGSALWLSGRMQDVVAWDVPFDATAAQADYDAYFATSFTPKIFWF